MEAEEERSVSLGTEMSASVPPPSPLTGCYLLIVLGEPHTAHHKEIILQRLVKGLLSWDVGDNHVDLEKELATLTQQAPEGEEARYGERLIQFASENLVTEILIHPQMNTLMQCMRNLLSSFTRHRHLIHSGYTFAGNGSWIMQDGTFSVSDFADAFQENEVQRVIRAYENSISIDIHCSTVGGEWTKLPDQHFARLCRIKINPTDILDTGSTAIKDFIAYVEPYVAPASIDQLLVPSDVVGNIRFSHPTLYVFPGGQGDAALFGINGFNMLVDGGFSRKACWWDFARHLDRLDAVLFTRLNNCTISGMGSVLQKKASSNVYPQIGHFFCNLDERRATASPDGDKDSDPLLVSLIQEGTDMMANLRSINLKPQNCYRDNEPINLYHKVGHGTLDMYVLNPSKDSKYVREFLKKWHSNDPKLFEGASIFGQYSFPIPNLVSICALIVWRPANQDDSITRIMFPGSTPQHKIFEGLEKIKHLEFLQHPTYTGKQMATSTTSNAEVIQSVKTARTATLKHVKTKNRQDKVIDPEQTPQPINNKDEVDKTKDIIDNKILNELIESSEEQKLQKILTDSTDEIMIESKIKKDSFKESARYERKQKKIIKSAEIKNLPAKTSDLKELLNKTDTKIQKSKNDASQMVRSKPMSKIFQKSKDKKQNNLENNISPLASPKKGQLATKILSKDVLLSRESHLEEKNKHKLISMKSSKEAANRKVAESKYKSSSPKRESTMQTKLSEKKGTMNTKREPISRRPKPIASPIKAIKTLRSPTKTPKNIEKKVSRPKAQQNVNNNFEELHKKSDEETSRSIDEVRLQELDDKEEQEIVREIEAVFNRDSETDDKNDFVARSDIEKITDSLNQLNKNTGQILDSEYEEEYLIIEKEDIERTIDDSVNQSTYKTIDDRQEVNKHLKDSQESEKQRMVTKKDKLNNQSEIRIKISSEKHEDINSYSKTATRKEINGLETRKDSKTSFDPKKDLSEKLLQESMNDEKASNTAESGTTTAPTLPEDERIALDEAKESNENIIKHGEKQTEENKFSKIKDTSPPTSLPSALRSQKKSAREIVKTPDEVADLPLHEVAEYPISNEEITAQNKEDAELKSVKMSSPSLNMEDSLLKRPPQIGFIQEIKPKSIPITKPEAFEENVVVKTVQTMLHPEVVTVTPTSLPDSPVIEMKTSEKSFHRDFDSYKFVPFTEKLRETHITTVDSPTTEENRALDDANETSEKFPIIKEDIEKEIEEASIIQNASTKTDISPRALKSPAEIEKIVTDVAEVLRSDKSLDEIISKKTVLLPFEAAQSKPKVEDRNQEKDQSHFEAISLEMSRSTEDNIKISGDIHQESTLLLPEKHLSKIDLKPDDKMLSKESAQKKTKKEMDLSTESSLKIFTEEKQSSDLRDQESVEKEHFQMSKKELEAADTSEKEIISNEASDEEQVSDSHEGQILLSLNEYLRKPSSDDSKKSFSDKISTDMESTALVTDMEQTASPKIKPDAKLKEIKSEEDKGKDNIEKIKVEKEVNLIEKSEFSQPIVEKDLRQISSKELISETTSAPRETKSVEKENDLNEARTKTILVANDEEKSTSQIKTDEKVVQFDKDESVLGQTKLSIKTEYDLKTKISEDQLSTELIKVETSEETAVSGMILPDTKQTHSSSNQKQLVHTDLTVSPMRQITHSREESPEFEAFQTDADNENEESVVLKTVKDTEPTISSSMTTTEREFKEMKTQEGIQEEGIHEVGKGVISLNESEIGQDQSLTQDLAKISSEDMVEEKLFGLKKTISVEKLNALDKGKTESSLIADIDRKIISDTKKGQKEAIQFDIDESEMVHNKFFMEKPGTDLKLTVHEGDLSEKPITLETNKETLENIAVSGKMSQDTKQAQTVSDPQESFHTDLQLTVSPLRTTADTNKKSDQLETSEQEPVAVDEQQNVMIKTAVTDTESKTASSTITTDGKRKILENETGITVKDDNLKVAVGNEVIPLDKSEIILQESLKQDPEQISLKEIVSEKSTGTLKTDSAEKLSAIDDVKTESSLLAGADKESISDTKEVQIDEGQFDVNKSELVQSKLSDGKVSEEQSQLESRKITSEHEATPGKMSPETTQTDAHMLHTNLDLTGSPVEREAAEILQAGGQLFEKEPDAVEKKGKVMITTVVSDLELKTASAEMAMVGEMKERKAERDIQDKDDASKIAVDKEVISLEKSDIAQDEYSKQESEQISIKGLISERTSGTLNIEPVVKLNALSEVKTESSLLFGADEENISDTKEIQKDDGQFDGNKSVLGQSELLDKKASEEQHQLELSKITSEKEATSGKMSPETTQTDAHMLHTTLNLTGLSVEREAADTLQKREQLETFEKELNADDEKEKMMITTVVSDSKLETASAEMTIEGEMKDIKVERDIHDKDNAAKIVVDKEVISLKKADIAQDESLKQESVKISLEEMVSEKSSSTLKTNSVEKLSAIDEVKIESSLLAGADEESISDTKEIQNDDGQLDENKSVLDQSELPDGKVSEEQSQLESRKITSEHEATPGKMSPETTQTDAHMLHSNLDLTGSPVERQAADILQEGEQLEPFEKHSDAVEEEGKVMITTLVSDSELKAASVDMAIEGVMKEKKAERDIQDKDDAAKISVDKEVISLNKSDIAPDESLKQESVKISLEEMVSEKSSSTLKTDSVEKLSAIDEVKIKSSLLAGADEESISDTIEIQNGDGQFDENKSILDQSELPDGKVSEEQSQLELSKITSEHEATPGKMSPETTQTKVHMLHTNLDLTESHVERQAADTHHEGEPDAVKEKEKVMITTVVSDSELKTASVEITIEGEMKNIRAEGNIQGKDSTAKIAVDKEVNSLVKSDIHQNESLKQVSEQISLEEIVSEKSFETLKTESVEKLSAIDEVKTESSLLAGADEKSISDTKEIQNGDGQFDENKSALDQSELSDGKVSEEQSQLEISKITSEHEATSGKMSPETTQTDAHMLHTNLNLTGSSVEREAADTLQTGEPDAVEEKGKVMITTVVSDSELKAASVEMTIEGDMKDIKAEGDIQDKDGAAKIAVDKEVISLVKSNIDQNESLEQKLEQQSLKEMVLEKSSGTHKIESNEKLIAMDEVKTESGLLVGADVESISDTKEIRNDDKQFDGNKSVLVQRKLSDEKLSEEQSQLESRKITSEHEATPGKMSPETTQTDAHMLQTNLDLTESHVERQASDTLQEGEPDAVEEKGKVMITTVGSDSKLKAASVEMTIEGDMKDTKAEVDIQDKYDTAKISVVKEVISLKKSDIAQDESLKQESVKISLEEMVSEKSSSTLKTNSVEKLSAIDEVKIESSLLAGADEESISDTKEIQNDDGQLDENKSVLDQSELPDGKVSEEQSQLELSKITSEHEATPGKMSPETTQTDVHMLQTNLDLTESHVERQASDTLQEGEPDAVEEKGKVIITTVVSDSKLKAASIEVTIEGDMKDTKAEIDIQDKYDTAKISVDKEVISLKKTDIAQDESLKQESVKISLEEMVSEKSSSTLKTDSVEKLSAIDEVKIESSLLAGADEESISDTKEIQNGDGQFDENKSVLDQSELPDEKVSEEQSQLELSKITSKHEATPGKMSPETTQTDVHMLHTNLALTESHVERQAADTLQEGEPDAVEENEKVMITTLVSDSELKAASVEMTIEGEMKDIKAEGDIQDKDGAAKIAVDKEVNYFVKSDIDQNESLKQESEQQSLKEMVSEKSSGTLKTDSAEKLSAMDEDKTECVLLVGAEKESISDTKEVQIDEGQFDGNKSELVQSKLSDGKVGEEQSQLESRKITSEHEATPGEMSPETTQTDAHMLHTNLDLTGSPVEREAADIIQEEEHLDTFEKEPDAVDEKEKVMITTVVTDLEHKAASVEMTIEGEMKDIKAEGDIQDKDGAAKIAVDKEVISLVKSDIDQNESLEQESEQQSLKEMVSEKSSGQEGEQLETFEKGPDAVDEKEKMMITTVVSDSELKAASVEITIDGEMKDIKVGGDIHDKDNAAKIVVDKEVISLKKSDIAQDDSLKQVLKRKSLDEIVLEKSSGTHETESNEKLSAVDDVKTESSLLAGADEESISDTKEVQIDEGQFDGKKSELVQSKLSDGKVSEEQSQLESRKITSEHEATPGKISPETTLTNAHMLHTNLDLTESQVETQAADTLQEGEQLKPFEKEPDAVEGEGKIMITTVVTDLEHKAASVEMTIESEMKDIKAEGDIQDKDGAAKVAVDKEVISLVKSDIDQNESLEQESEQQSLKEMVSEKSSGTLKTDSAEKLSAIDDVKTESSLLAGADKESISGTKEVQIDEGQFDGNKSELVQSKLSDGKVGEEQSQLESRKITSEHEATPGKMSPETTQTDAHMLYTNLDLTGSPVEREAADTIQEEEHFDTFEKEPDAVDEKGKVMITTVVTDLEHKAASEEMTIEGEMKYIKAEGDIQDRDDAVKISADKELISLKKSEIAEDKSLKQASEQISLKGMVSEKTSGTLETESVEKLYEVKTESSLLVGADEKSISETIEGLNDVVQVDGHKSVSVRSKLPDGKVSEEQSQFELSDTSCRMSPETKQTDSQTFDMNSHLTESFVGRKAADTLQKSDRFDAFVKKPDTAEGKENMMIITKVTELEPNLPEMKVEFDLKEIEAEGVIRDKDAATRITVAKEVISLEKSDIGHDGSLKQEMGQISPKEIVLKTSSGTLKTESVEKMNAMNKVKTEFGLLAGADEGSVSDTEEVQNDEGLFEGNKSVLVQKEFSDGKVREKQSHLEISKTNLVNEATTGRMSPETTQTDLQTLHKEFDLTRSPVEREAADTLRERAQLDKFKIEPDAVEEKVDLMITTGVTALELKTASGEVTPKGEMKKPKAEGDIQDEDDAAKITDNKELISSEKSDTAQDESLKQQPEKILLKETVSEKSSGTPKTESVEKLSDMDEIKTESSLLAGADEESISDTKEVKNDEFQFDGKKSVSVQRKLSNRKVSEEQSQIEFGKISTENEATSGKISQETTQTDTQIHHKDLEVTISTVVRKAADTLKESEQLDTFEKESDAVEEKGKVMSTTLVNDLELETASAEMTMEGLMKEIKPDGDIQDKGYAAKIAVNKEVISLDKSDIAQNESLEQESEQISVKKIKSENIDTQEKEYLSKMHVFDIKETKDKLNIIVDEQCSFNVQKGQKYAVQIEGDGDDASESGKREIYMKMTDMDKQPDEDVKKVVSSSQALNDSKESLDSDLHVTVTVLPVKAISKTLQENELFEKLQMKSNDIEGPELEIISMAVKESDSETITTKTAPKSDQKLISQEELLEHQSAKQKLESEEILFEKCKINKDKSISENLEQTSQCDNIPKQVLDTHKQESRMAGDTTRRETSTCTIIEEKNIQATPELQKKDVQCDGDEIALGQDQLPMKTPEKELNLTITGEKPRPNIQKREIERELQQTETSLKDEDLEPLSNKLVSEDNQNKMVLGTESVFEKEVETDMIEKKSGATKLEYSSETPKIEHEKNVFEDSKQLQIETKALFDRDNDEVEVEVVTQRILSKEDLVLDKTVSSDKGNCLQKEKVQEFLDQEKRFSSEITKNLPVELQPNNGKASSEKDTNQDSKSETDTNIYESFVAAKQLHEQTAMIVQQGIKSEDIMDYDSQKCRPLTPPTVPVSPLPATQDMTDEKINPVTEFISEPDRSDTNNESVTKIVHIGEDMVTQKISTSTEKLSKAESFANMEIIQKSLGKIHTETDTVTKVIKDGDNVVTQTVTTVTTKEIISESEGTPQNVKTTVETTTITKGSDGTTDTTRDTQTLYSDWAIDEFKDTNVSYQNETKSALKMSSNHNYYADEIKPTTSTIDSASEGLNDEQNLETTTIDTNVSKSVFKEDGIDIIVTETTITKKELMDSNDGKKTKTTIEKNIVKEYPGGKTSEETFYDVSVDTLDAVTNTIEETSDESSLNKQFCESYEFKQSEDLSQHHKYLSERGKNELLSEQEQTSLKTEIDGDDLTSNCGKKIDFIDLNVYSPISSPIETTESAREDVLIGECVVIRSITTVIRKEHFEHQHTKTQMTKTTKVVTTEDEYPDGTIKTNVSEEVTFGSADCNDPSLELITAESFEIPDVITNRSEEIINKNGIDVKRVTITKTKENLLETPEAMNMRRVRQSVETTIIDEYPDGSKETLRDVKITVSESKDTCSDDLKSILEKFVPSGRTKSFRDTKNKIITENGNTYNQTILTLVTKEELKCLENKNTAIKTITETITDTNKHGVIETTKDIQTVITYLPPGSDSDEWLTNEQDQTEIVQPDDKPTDNGITQSDENCLEPKQTHQTPVGEITTDVKTYTNTFKEGNSETEQIITVVTTKEIISSDKMKVTVETTTVNKGSDGFTRTTKSTKTTITEIKEEYEETLDSHISKVTDVSTEKYVDNQRVPILLSEKKLDQAFKQESTRESSSGDLYYSDDDEPGSLSSVKSQIGLSPKSNLSFEMIDPEITKSTESLIPEIPMSTSIVGASPTPENLNLPKESSQTSSKIEDIQSNESQMSENVKHQSKIVDTTDLSSGSVGASAHTPQNESRQEHSVDKNQILEHDPIKSWGKPLGLPSPTGFPTPPDGKGTPKKSAVVSSKNKINLEKTRDSKSKMESPIKIKKSTPIYMDLTYVPHHGNSYYAAIDFFKRIRARYYVFSGTEPSKEIYNALLDAKKTWEDKDLEVTIIPTYDTDVLGYWVTENEEALIKYKIDLSPSASRCTINLQDHETSCAAYRLEF